MDGRTTEPEPSAGNTGMAEAPGGSALTRVRLGFWPGNVSTGRVKPSAMQDVVRTARPIHPSQYRAVDPWQNNGLTVDVFLRDRKVCGIRGGADAFEAFKIPGFE